jgi:ATP-dependent exoDNAse (exonuclease V) beta subunit
VTWWDPHALLLGVESGFGLRRDDLIVKDGDMFAVEDNLATYERWREERLATIDRGARASMTVETVTAWTRAAPPPDLLDTEPDYAIETITVAAAEGRPFGPRFGTLVHAVLATVPLDAGEDVVRAVAGTQSRILNATAEETSAAIRAAGAVLAHPLIARARIAAGSGRCYRESPVTWRTPGGALLEGTVDLAFEDAEGLTALDFKTDRELASDLDRYKRQLTIYCRALEAVRGIRPRGVLMRI